MTMWEYGAVRGMNENDICVSLPVYQVDPYIEAEKKI
jgi:hypothetical protein